MTPFLSNLLSNVFTGVAIVFAFGLVVCIHEFGHFIVAKKSGVKVDRFSFGLGPEMIGFQWGETRYCIAWLPLGGEVRMAGEFSEDGKMTVEPGSADTARHFFAQPWYRRILIAFAGPFMNYVLAAAIFFGMLVIWGEPVQSNKNQVGEVVVGMPAAQAGIIKGDWITSVQGEKVEDFQSIRDKISSRAGQATELTLLRDNKEVKVSLTPDAATKKIGIAPADPVTEKHKVGLLSAGKQSIWMCWFISKAQLVYIKQKIVARERPDVAGPLGIGQVIAKAVKSGAEDFFYLVAMISVALGLFNLFPVPMLDGGHVLYYVIEGITGKPVSPNVMGKANVVGLALLLGLLVFATFNDIQRFRQPKAQVSETAPAPSPVK